ncbi:hypothetical protein M3J09_012016 [Ascochyta lentis]
MSDTFTPESLAGLSMVSTRWIVNRRSQTHPCKHLSAWSVTFLLHRRPYTACASLHLPFNFSATAPSQTTDLNQCVR